MLSPKSAFAALSLGLLLFAACKKEETRGPEETYAVKGVVNTSRSTIAGTATTDFTLKYNVPSTASNKGLGLLTGRLTWTGFSSTPDSVWLYANKSDGSVASYLTISRTVLSTNTYTFTNTAAGSLQLNLPLTLEGATPFINAGGFIKVGKSGSYLYVDLNSVVKQ